MITKLKRKLFWNTLRLVNKKPGVLKKGVRVNTIVNTFCPLHCEYCPMYFYGDPKRYVQSSFEEWKVFFERFPHWISLVYISGGEPSLYKDIVPLVNWLIARGHHVMIFSNLWRVENYFGIKKHWRLLFYPTFHHSDNRLRFIRNYNKLVEKGYTVAVKEFLNNELNFSNEAVLFDKNYFQNIDDTIHLAPDTSETLRMFVGCIELYRREK